jgi:diguanylate cyclase (GGDEF)-like protein
MFPAEADAAAAAMVAERLTVHELRSGDGHATASFGIAVYPEDGKTSAALLRTADRALYQAKHAGKDRLAGAIVLA